MSEKSLSEMRNVNICFTFYSILDPFFELSTVA